MQKWRESNGAASVDEITKEMHQLRHCQGVLQASPAAHCQLLNVGFPTAVAARFADSSHSSMVHKALGQQTTALHRAVMHGDCPEIKEPKLAPAGFAAIGVCVCSNRGRLLKKIRKQFHDHLKLVCKKGRPAWDMLCGKGIVVRISGIGAGDEPSPWAGALGHVSAPGRLSGDVWLHVAAHSFKPYASTFRLLRFLNVVEEQGVTEITLEAPGAPMLVTRVAPHKGLVTRVAPHMVGTALANTDSSLWRPLCGAPWVPHRQAKRDVMHDWALFASMDLECV